MKEVAQPGKPARKPSFNLNNGKEHNRDNGIRRIQRGHGQAWTIHHLGNRRGDEGADRPPNEAQAATHLQGQQAAREAEVQPVPGVRQ